MQRSATPFTPVRFRPQPPTSTNGAAGISSPRVLVNFYSLLTSVITKKPAGAGFFGFILEHGYGCEVEVTKGSTTPIMAAHYDGQLDIVTELWV